MKKQLPTVVLVGTYDEGFRRIIFPSKYIQRELLHRFVIAHKYHFFVTKNELSIAVSEKRAKEHSQAVRVCPIAVARAAVGRPHSHRRAFVLRSQPRAAHSATHSQMLLNPHVPSAYGASMKTSA